MLIWIGIRQDGEIIHEWNGDLDDEGNIGKVIGNAIASFTKETGKDIWGSSIMIDKAGARAEEQAAR